MKRRKICVVTGSRAEYGLLKPLLHEINQHTSLELKLVVCFMHLVNEFGSTIDEIKQDGFSIDYTVDMMLANDNCVAQVKSMGLGLISFADVFDKIKPDLLIVLGDRFEILSAVQAAFMSRIPIAHIHGGELTKGALDDSIRHAITKLSHIHFASAQTYKNRILQLGEMPEHVYNVGALALSNIKNIKLYHKKELEQLLNIQFNDTNFLVTYHPVTLDQNLTKKGLYSLLDALSEYPKATIIFTKSNADEGGQWINSTLNDYVARDPTHRYLFSSLGVKRYLSMMSVVDVVIGNSSSAIIEAPFMGKPSIDIGLREENRIKPVSVISCNEDKDSILQAMKKTMSDNFKNSIKQIENPYGEGTTEKRIVEIIAKIDLSNIVLKSFFDREIVA